MMSDLDRLLGSEVKVHWNRHKRLFAIKGKSGRVEGYACAVKLRNCAFVVGPKSRDRVRRTGVRSVHAYIKGTFEGSRSWHELFESKVYYSPFVTDTWVDEKGLPVTKALDAFLTLGEDLSPEVFANIAREES